MKKNRTPELSVVILSYKSGEFAKVFHKKVKSTLTLKKISHEIILVGNYWSRANDITPSLVNQIAASDNKTIAVAKKKVKPSQNMGWDMKSGLKVTTGAYIAVIDGDGQMSIQDIPKLLKKIKNGKFDLCKTKRTIREDGLYRLMVSKTYNLLMQILFPGIKSDINSKPKIFRRDIYEKLNLISNDWFIDAEIMIKARKLGLRIGEINTKFVRNPNRKSFVTFAENFEFMKNIIKWRLDEFSS